MRRVNYPWFVAVLVAVTILYTMLFACKVNAQTTTEEDTTVNVSTTMYNNCYDTTTFKGKARIEQMFVDDVYNEDGCYQVLLVDTKENEWVMEEIDLNLYEEVLVLLVDNETEDDITDDVIVHCWVGIE